MFMQRSDVASLVEFSEWFFLIYFLALNLIYLILNVISLFSIKRYVPTRILEEMPYFLGDLMPPISVLVPAYNEEFTIVTTVKSLLQQDYPEFEIVVVNDGSTDNTLRVLQEGLKLVPFPEAFRVNLPTKPIQRIYRSTRYPNIRVIDKENGGKADSLNAGINASRYPFFCSVDADTVLVRDSLRRAIVPFTEDDRVVVSGGTVRIANGCKVNEGVLTQVGLPSNLLALFQIVEYLRAFLFGRVGWSAMNALLVVSGAFGIFRKDVAIEVGGYRTDTLGEDMEIIVRIHRVLRKIRQDYRIVFVPDPVCWTEAPESLSVLGRQRMRWQQGLAESLFKNTGLLFQRRGGAAGWIAYPFAVLFELLGPFIEVAGYLLMPLFYLFGFINFTTFWLFIFAAFSVGLLLSISGLWLEELSFSTYTKPRQLVVLILVAILENLGYRQINAFWRIFGMLEWLSRKRKKWGEMTRRAEWVKVSH
jgi:cellulose synthase/poly-beta-1,6-N-acetylglucosamine synthase-like glycosyltransferase